MIVPVIAIDGPAASGKSSVASQLAYQINFNLLISGALYRIIGYMIKEQKIDPHDMPAIERAANAIKVDFISTNEGFCVLNNGEEVTDVITKPEYAEAASYAGILPTVRKALFEIQRKYRCAPGLVAEGRDMTSNVFKEAEIKVLLTASIEVRAERRRKQLNCLGINANLNGLIEDIASRDRQDSERELNPLTEVPGVLKLDTTELSIEATVELLIKIAREQGIVPKN